MRSLTKKALIQRSATIYNAVSTYFLQFARNFHECVNSFPPLSKACSVMFQPVASCQLEVHIPPQRYTYHQTHITIENTAVTVNYTSYRLTGVPAGKNKFQDSVFLANFRTISGHFVGFTRFKTQKIHTFC